MAESQQNDLPKWLTDELLALGQKIWAEARKTDRQKIMEYLGIEEPSRPLRPRSAKPGSQYGQNSSAVREALKELSAVSPDGVDAGTLALYFERLGTGPNLAQCRAALKTLTLNGDARNVARGKYLSREAIELSPASGDPDAGASGQFALAAE